MCVCVVVEEKKTVSTLSDEEKKTSHERDQKWSKFCPSPSFKPKKKKKEKKKRAKLFLISAQQNTRTREREREESKQFIRERKKGCARTSSSLIKTIPNE